MVASGAVPHAVGETHVRVRRSGDVHLVGSGEGALVEIRQPEVHQDEVAGSDRDTSDFDVLSGIVREDGAAEARRAHELVHRGPHQSGIGDQLVPQLAACGPLHAE
jgi:hypothetical protein